MSRRPTVLTLSVTLVPVTTLFRSSIDAALESSDRALYAAKANGRDCVKTAITASCALLPGFRPCRSGSSREPWGPRQKLAAEAAPATALAGGGIRACYPSDHVLQGRLPMRRPGRGVPLLAMLLAVTAWPASTPFAAEGQQQQARGEDAIHNQEQLDPKSQRLKLKHKCA